MRCLDPRYVNGVVTGLLALGGCGRVGFDSVSEEAVRGGRPVDREDHGTSDASLPDPDERSLDSNVDAGFEVNHCALPEGALACSDFENGLPSNMFVESNEGSISTQDGFIEASTNAESGWARARATFPAITSGSIYLRMSMFIRSSSILDLVNFAELVESNAPGTGVDFNFRFGQLEVYSHEERSSYVCSGCFAPRDQWFCFRARVDLGDGDGRVRTFIEDALLHDIQGIDTLSSGGMEEAAVGINWVDSQQPPAHLMIDDLVVSTSPLTSCP